MNRYASIREMDVTNGAGIGVALFTQGCPHMCKGCFNPETWSFKGGKAWNSDVEETFFNCISKSYITRVSILGGEPLCSANVSFVSRLVNKIKNVYPNKKIWLWTGYTINECQNDELKRNVLDCCDTIIDGKFVDELKDLKLKFRGSSNQNIWVKTNNVWVNTTKGDNKNGKQY